MDATNLSINSIDTAIIEYLISCQDYSDSYQIARTLGINRRQVRSEIVNVREILSCFGFSLESKRSKGYRIVERDHLSELQQQLKRYAFENSISYSYSQEGRRDYLAQILVSHCDYLKIDDLADSLYVSRSTLINDLSVLNESLLKKNHTLLENKARKGVRITGKEISKREILCDLFFNIYSKNNYYNKFLDSFTDEKCEMEHNILATLRRYDIVMSDIALCDFLIYLTVMCMRVCAGETLNDSPDPSLLRFQTEYDVARIISTQISNHLEIYLNEYEVNYIAIKLIAKESSSIRKEIIQDEKTLAVVEDSLQQIYERCGIRFHKGSHYKQFCSYIDTTLMILQFNEKVRHPYYLTARENQPLAYELALITAEVLHQHSGHFISSSHIAFYSIFFNNWIQSIWNRKRRVLLICGLGVGATESVAHELEYHLGRYLDIRHTCMYHELNMQNLRDYDLLISTFPLPEPIELPSVTVSQFVSEDDINRVRTLITSDYDNFQAELAFSPSLFCYENVLSSQEDIADIMIGMLCNQFPKLKPSYVRTTLESKHNEFTYLKNGILFMQLERSLNSLNSSVVCLLRHPYIYNEQNIHAIIVVSSSDRDYYDALREASRVIGRDELIRLVESGNVRYADFVHLYKEEW